MSMSSIPSSSQSGKLYGWVERIGNKVPHPFLLFIYLIIVLMVTTAILSAFGVSAKNPTDGTPVVVKNLLSVEGLHWFLPNVIKNFSGFAPLGAILALVLGAGLAERVGLLPALMVKMASHVNARYASYMVLFIAFFSHISSDAALVIMPPMGALIFLAVGRHPVAGLLASNSIYRLPPCRGYKKRRPSAIQDTRSRHPPPESAFLFPPSAPPLQKTSLKAFYPQ